MDRTGTMSLAELTDAADVSVRTVRYYIAEGLLPEAERLISIHDRYSTVVQVMSAALANPFKEEGWTASFRELLTTLTNYPSLQRLRDDISAMQTEVQAAAAGCYERVKSFPVER